MHLRCASRHGSLVRSKVTERKFIAWTPGIVTFARRKHGLNNIRRESTEFPELEYRKLKSDDVITYRRYYGVYMKRREGNLGSDKDEKRDLNRDPELRSEKELYNEKDLEAATLIHETISLPENTLSGEDISFCNQLRLDRKEFCESVLCCRNLHFGLCNTGSWNTMLGTFDGSKLNDLIAYCAYIGDVDSSKIIFEFLTRAATVGKNRPEFAFICVMGAHARSGDLAGAKVWFEKASTYNLQKNSSLWSFLLEAYKTSGDIEGAFLCLEKSKDSNVIPTPEMCDNLLEACAEFKDLKRLWHLFEFVRLKLFQPNVRTYTIMIKACAESMSVEKAINLFEEALSRNVPKHIDLYNALMHSYNSRDDYAKRTHEVFGSIIAANIIPNNKTYELLLKSASMSSDKKQMKNILDDFYSKINDTKYENIFFECSDILRYIIDTSSAYIESKRNINSNGENEEDSGEFVDGKFSSKNILNGKKDLNWGNLDVKSEPGGGNINEGHTEDFPCNVKLGNQDMVSTCRKPIDYKKSAKFETHDTLNHSEVENKSLNNTEVASLILPESTLESSPFLIEGLTDSISTLTNSVLIALDTGISNNENSSQNTKDIPSSQIDDHEKLILKKSVYIIDGGDEFSLDDAINNVFRVWDYCRICKPQLVNPHIIISILKFLTACPKKDVDPDMIMRIFSNFLKKYDLETPLEIFPLVLHWAGNDKRISNKFSLNIFDAYINIDSKLETNSFGLMRSDYSQIELMIHELERTKQCRPKSYAKNMFTFMANVLASDGKTDEALQLIKKSSTFRYKGYLMKPAQDEVLHVFWNCYKEAYCEQFRPLAIFYTLVIPSSKKILSIPSKNIDFPVKMPTSPYLEEPSLDTIASFPLVEPPKKVKVYPFYPQRSKSKKNTSY